jgi:hypothetical protein
VHIKIEGWEQCRKGVKKLQISNFVLQDIDVDIVAWYATFETYLQYIRVIPELIPDRDQTLSICGNVRKLLKDAGPASDYYIDGLTQEKITLRNTNIGKIRNIMNTFPIELLYNFDLSIEDDLFMEVLLNNFRNELIINNNNRKYGFKDNDCTRTLHLW